MNKTLKEKLLPIKIIFERPIKAIFERSDWSIESVQGGVCRLVAPGMEAKSCKVADLDIDIVDLTLIFNDLYSTKQKTVVSFERNQITALEYDFYPLAEKALIKSGFTKEQANLIEHESYFLHHSSGYGEIINGMIDLAEFAKNILKANILK